MSRYAIGFDVGGTKLAVSLAREDNEEITILNKIKVPTPVGPIAALDRMLEGMDTLLRDAGMDKNDVCGIGVSCGGPLDSKKGLILSPPNLPGWDEVPIIANIKERCGIDAYLQNDADACALAEWKYGAGKGTNHMIFLTFGTGLGAGLILDSKLYTGACDMAGEIGHCRAPLTGGVAYSPVGYGKAGSFEGFCSGGGIAELGRSIALECIQMGKPAAFCPTLDDLPGLSAKIIGDAADAGDPIAKSVYDACGERLGAALSLFIDLLNPEAIVIGSIYTRSENLLRESVLKVIEREALSRSASVCRILPAALGESLGDMAAAAVAFSHAPNAISLRTR